MSDTGTPPRTREELYRRIRETSKDEFILEEMVRLGFWPSEEKVPTLQAEKIRRTGELQRELGAVRTELSRLENEEAMRKAIRKRRMAEARQKREETKIRHEEERRKRAEAWKEAKTRDILYLGEGVSHGLRDKENNPERLEQYRLPVFAGAADIAGAMGISVGELRFLAFSRKVSSTTHYKRFYIPKKTGGQRLISAPMPRLKDAQLWVLENILNRVPVHDAAHGFLAGRSIVGNARPHVGRDVVVNMDIKDFFPTVTYGRVKGLFRSLGYSEQAAIVFGLLCTEPEVDEVSMDNETYYVAAGERFLPQGAPSSPMLTNIICRRLDKRLEKLAGTLGFTYTRYADDLTFSGSKESRENLGKLLSKTRGIIEHEGFTVHPDKTRILHRGRKQEVTGIVVNDQVSVDRKTLRRLRAVLFQLEKDGPDGKRWGMCPDVIASVEGYAHFVFMVDPEKGKALLDKVEQIKSKTRYKKPVYKRYPKRVPSWKKSKLDGEPTEHTEDTEKEKHQKPWWKFW